MIIDEPRVFRITSRGSSGPSLPLGQVRVGRISQFSEAQPLLLLIVILLLIETGGSVMR
jgi:hypothetical protein